VGGIRRVLDHTRKRDEPASSGAENRFIIDDVESTDLVVGVSAVPVTPDFLEEIQVKSSGYPAEFGGSWYGRRWRATSRRCARSPARRAPSRFHRAPVSLKTSPVGP
jgi:hypothetical protein